MLPGAPRSQQPPVQVGADACSGTANRSMVTTTARRFRDGPVLDSWITTLKGIPCRTEELVQVCGLHFPSQGWQELRVLSVCEKAARRCTVRVEKLPVHHRAPIQQSGSTERCLRNETEM